MQKAEVWSPKSKVIGQRRSKACIALSVVRVCLGAGAGGDEDRDAAGFDGGDLGFEGPGPLNLLIVGEPTVSTPPPVPAFDSNVVQGLELTNPGGVVAIKLTCSGSSDAFHLV